MIRTYCIARKKLKSGDITSSKALNAISNKADWLWVDCVNLDDKEIKIISDFFGVEAKILNDIRKEKTYPSCERYRDYSLISIPFVEFEKTLQVHPISVIMKEKMLITLRDKNSTELVGKVVETLGSYLIENGEVLPSFVVSRFFREMAEENSRVMISLKEQIDKVEEEALENPRDKSVTRSVFGLKREISTLHRLLWVGKELISDVKECVVPHVKLDEEAEKVLEEAEQYLKKEKIHYSVSSILGSNPSRALVNVAKHENFDLIVVGSRGLGSAASFLLGSVSRRVVSKSHCDVLVIKK